MKVAAYLSTGRPAALEADVVRRMLQAQDADAEQGRPAPPEVAALPHGALGWRRTSDRLAPFPLALRGRQGNLLVVCGSPVHCGGQLPALLARAVDDELGAAARSLTQLDGGFAALLWDAAGERLAIVTDFVGFQPLYVARRRDGSGLLVATEQRGILASGLVDLAPDPAAWGALVGFGHHLGDHTSVAAVRRAPAGSVLVYHARAGAWSDDPPAARGYWRWPMRSRHTSLAQVDTGAIAGALAESVDGYRAYGQSGAVLMSGGFDSRLVACVVKRAGLAPTALIVGHPEEHDDADGRYAVAAARRLGLPYEVHQAAPDFYATEAYRRYVRLAEGSNTSLGLFIARVASFIRPEHGAVWEGVAPNAMQRLNRNPQHGGFAAYLARACRGRASREWQAASYLFSRRWADEMHQRLVETVRAEVARYADDEFGVFEFAVRNRTRNRLAANPYKVFAEQALPFTPGVTRAFFDRVYELSGAIRGLSELRVKVFREHFPEALDVPFCSGGKLLDGSPRPSVAFAAAQLRARVLRSWRVRSALERAGVLRPVAFDLSRVLRGALAAVDLDDPRLDADAVRSLRSGEGANDPVRAQAREYLFYWQTWSSTLPASVATAHRLPPTVIGGTVPR
jgi:hypothetical protein